MLSDAKLCGRQPYKIQYYGGYQPSLFDILLWEGSASPSSTTGQETSVVGVPRQVGRLAIKKKWLYYKMLICLMISIKTGGY